MCGFLFEKIDKRRLCLWTFANSGLDWGPSRFLIHCYPNLGDIFGLQTEFFSPRYLQFRYELHVMVDEIYMLSVFEESARYHSVLSLER